MLLVGIRGLTRSPIEAIIEEEVSVWRRMMVLGTGASVHLDCYCLLNVSITETGLFVFLYHAVAKTQ